MNSVYFYSRAGHCARRFPAGTVAGPTLILRYKDEVSYERCRWPEKSLIEKETF
jgi:hypothetical protein